MSQVGLWAKSVVGAVSAGLSAALVALQDGHIEQFEWIGIALAAVVALAAVKGVSNAASGPLYFAKAILAAVIAALGALGTALADGQGITPNEWIIVFLAVLSALPVAITSDAVQSDQFRGVIPPQ